MKEEHPGDRLLRAASAVLPAREVELLNLLHAFTTARFASATRGRQQLLAHLDAADPVDAVQAALHGFLRDCWDALDGLGRLVNVCMFHVFPDVGLLPPLSMTRQCTFYVVRKALHEHPRTAGHPVSRLLWDRTRQSPDAAYARLSFLYNLSLFVPVPLFDGDLLPGANDVPDALRGIVRRPSSEALARVPAAEGTSEILEWLGGMLNESCSALAATLTGE